MTTGPGPIGRGVEHDEVGVGARGDAAAVAQTVEAGGHVGEQVHGLLERKHLVLAHGLGQRRGRVVEGGEQVEVRARVRRADHRAPSRHTATRASQSARSLPNSGVENTVRRSSAIAMSHSASNGVWPRSAATSPTVRPA